jgi:histidinol-phosphate aminotransferase
MRLVRLPYHLSAFTQAAAEAALDHSSELLATVADIQVQRDRLLIELEALGYDPYRSDANFVLFGGVENPDQMFEALLARGILIRNVGIPNTLRVTAGTASETTEFLTALAELTHRG